MIRRFPLHYIAIGVATIFVSLRVSAQDDTQKKEAARPSVEGSWSWEREGPNGTLHCLLRLNEKEGKVQGKFKDEEHELNVEDGTYKDGKVVLHFTVNLEDQQFKVTLQGDVKQSEIKGKVVVSTPDGDQEFDWNPKRTVALEDAVGHWQMVFTTPDGRELQPEFELKNEKGKPTVQFAGDAPIKVSNVKFSKGGLTFLTELEFDGQPLQVEYDLKLATKSLQGVLHYEFKETGEAGDLEIDGKRIK